MMLKNYEKNMMTRMATKSDIGDYGCARPPCPEPRGGGRRRAKPPPGTWKDVELEGIGKKKG